MASPRWKKVIETALSKHKNANVIQLATIDTDRLPHVRSLIFRSFLPTASQNFPLIVTTTDIRTPKVQQFLANPKVEIAWWIEPTLEQLRISGTASIIPAPAHPCHGRLSGPDMPADFDWEQARRETFNSLSGHMRASWCRPVPGSILDGGYEAAKEWPERLPKLGDKDASEEDLKNLEIAFGNFSLIAIDSVEIDYVELGVNPNQRTRFNREGEGWKETVLVP